LGYERPYAAKCKRIKQKKGMFPTIWSRRHRAELTDVIIPRRGRRRNNQAQRGGKSHRCRTPSNRFDFFTAVISPLVPEIETLFCRRTFITLPNSPLPSSPISTNSRSNLLGCVKFSKELSPLNNVQPPCASFPRNACCSCSEVVCDCDWV